MGQKVLFSLLYERTKSFTAQKNEKFGQTFKTTGRDATNLAVSSTYACAQGKEILS